jgi:hypothetical protein
MSQVNASVLVPNEACDDILRAASEFLATSIAAGANPGTVCSIAGLMLEYAFIVGDFEPEVSHQIVDDLKTRLDEVIDKRATSIDIDHVACRARALIETFMQGACELINEARANDNERKAN